MTQSNELAPSGAGSLKGLGSTSTVLTSARECPVTLRCWQHPCSQACMCSTMKLWLTTASFLPTQVLLMLLLGLPMGSQPMGYQISGAQLCIWCIPFPYPPHSTSSLLLQGKQKHQPRLQGSSERGKGDRGVTENSKRQRREHSEEVMWRDLRERSRYT